MISPENVAAINGKRLRDWGQQLTANHATPVVLIGVGHDQFSGELHILMPKVLPKEYAIHTLKTAIACLEAQVE